MSTETQGMPHCDICGNQHDEWPPGYGFAQPDAVWALSEQQRHARVMVTPDFCCIDGTRCFVLANLEIPIAGLASPWTLSLWAEVSSTDFSRFLESAARPAVSGEIVPGVLANALDAFSEPRDVKVEVHLGSSRVRPTLVADRSSDLGKAQHDGLSDRELHALLVAMGLDEF